MDESDADDIAAPLSLELMDPVAPEDMESEDIAAWVACFFLLLTVAIWSPEVIASALGIPSPDDMPPLDIAALELDVPFDIASPAEVCAVAAPATPALKVRASAVILTCRSI